jgi:septal ring factor EnvC (AmiA/AmiB activator)
VERLAEQEKANKQLSQKSKELKRSFALAQSANIELEKKVAELADALKTSQDKKKARRQRLSNLRRSWRRFRRPTKMISA